jgi:hypothetical protein
MQRAPGPVRVVFVQSAGLQERVLAIYSSAAPTGGTSRRLIGLLFERERSLVFSVPFYQRGLSKRQESTQSGARRALAAGRWRASTVRGGCNLAQAVAYCPAGLCLPRGTGLRTNLFCLFALLLQGRDAPPTCDSAQARVSETCEQTHRSRGRAWSCQRTRDGPRAAKHAAGGAAGGHAVGG